MVVLSEVCRIFLTRSRTREWKSLRGAGAEAEAGRAEKGIGGEQSRRLDRGIGSVGYKAVGERLPRSALFRSAPLRKQADAF
eukprot:764058-Hanusia_phi.AAC.3